MSSGEWVALLLARPLVLSSRIDIPTELLFWESMHAHARTHARPRTHTNGPLSLVVIFFVLCLLLLTWSIAGVACRACRSSGTFFIVTHTHTHTLLLSLWFLILLQNACWSSCWSQGLSSCKFLGSLLLPPTHPRFAHSPLGFFFPKHTFWFCFEDCQNFCWFSIQRPPSWKKVVWWSSCVIFSERYYSETRFVRTRLSTYTRL